MSLNKKIKAPTNTSLRIIHSLITIYTKETMLPRIFLNRIFSSYLTIN